MTERVWQSWLAKAKPGDWFEYHHGFLALDRALPGQGLTHRERQTLGRLADQLFAAAEQGLVHLVQERLGSGTYSYRVVARRRSSIRAEMTRGAELVLA